MRWKREGTTKSEYRGLKLCSVNRPVMKRARREMKIEVSWGGREEETTGGCSFGRDGKWEEKTRRKDLPSMQAAARASNPLIEWRGWSEGGISAARESVAGAPGNLRTSETDFEATEITSSGSRGILSIPPAPPTPDRLLSAPSSVRTIPRAFSVLCSSLDVTRLRGVLYRPTYSVATNLGRDTKNCSGIDRNRTHILQFFSILS